MLQHAEAILKKQFADGGFTADPALRPGTPEDIGRAVVFLCSPAAGCITGVSLPVDGGLLAGQG